MFGDCHQLTSNPGREAFDEEVTELRLGLVKSDGPTGLLAGTTGEGRAKYRAGLEMGPGSLLDVLGLQPQTTMALTLE